MIIQKLTNRLQDIGHSGDADKTVKIMVLDGIYDVGNIRRVESGDKIYFVIDAEGIGGKEKSNNEN